MTPTTARGLWPVTGRGHVILQNQETPAAKITNAKPTTAKEASVDIYSVETGTPMKAKNAMTTTTLTPTAAQTHVRMPGVVTGLFRREKRNVIQETATQIKSPTLVVPTVKTHIVEME
jgi:hypothetical protein